MAEELNQVQTGATVQADNVQEDNLFADTIETIEPDQEIDKEVVNESAKDETPKESVEEVVKEEPIETPKEMRLHIKFNGEEKDLNEDEARMFAQKGMNYDRIYEPLKRLANAQGLEVGDFLSSLEQTQIEDAVEREVEALKEKFPDTPNEVLNELAEKRVAETRQSQLQKIENEQRDNEAALKEEIERQVKIFKREYPDKDPSKLDDQVYEYVQQGYSITEAYNKFLTENKPVVSSEEIAQKQNEDNKVKSLGNITNAGDEAPDDFFSGFDSI